MKIIPNVILPLMKTGSFLVSAIAASGIPQFATGPQKCVLKVFKFQTKKTIKS